MGTPSRPLPDTAAWQPRQGRPQTLERDFYRCTHIEQLILHRANNEKEFNIDNFDSGLGIEDIVRDSIRELLPDRYAVDRGVLSDSRGYTSGDCDIVVSNHIWFPAIKEGATPQSRRKILPVEAAYSVIEVKQSLSADSLDAAMQKLVMCRRLYRPRVSRGRLVENRERGSCTFHNANPLHAAIIATGLTEQARPDEMFERFVRINQSLPRRDVINGLCILGEETLIWGYREIESAELKPALFMWDDQYLELIPVRSRRSESSPNSLYAYISYLLSHLYHSVLAPEDLAIYYGFGMEQIRVPKTPGSTLQPDALIPMCSCDAAAYKDGSSD
jgi:hypothetical protein